MTRYEDWIREQNPAPSIPEENIKKIAYVIDGKVVQTLSTDERMWAIILSNPTVIDITDIKFPDQVFEDGSTTQVYIDTDWAYDGTTFTPPA